VQNIAGRPVATIANGEPVPAGTNSLAWNLMSRDGTKVPAGRYVVTVEAVSETGQRVQAVRTIAVNR
jgi:hypothetical protein